jgi:gamma-butyrobetaine dioxygenase
MIPNETREPPRLIRVSETELVARMPDGAALPIHPIWLRERSEAPEAMDRITGQRLHDPSDLPLDLSITDIIDLGADRFEVRFSDHHAAVYDSARLAREIALPAGDHDLPPVRLWTGDLTELPRFEWAEAADAATRRTWVTAFLEYGFVIFTGVPSTDRSVIHVGQTFGHVRDTNFGDMFNVRSVPNANDLAYTAIELGAHTDNPYRTPVPGVQLLHCLINETTGGLSTLVDGLAVATALRERDPEAFAALSETPVRFRFQDPTTELVASAPPIELDVTGAIRGIHMSPRLDYVPLMAPDRLDTYYRARKVFDHMLRDPAFEIRFLLEDGDLVMFDNVRLLHGRTSFDPAEGLRHLQGCYIDIDGPRSLYRVLRRDTVA